MKIIHHDSLAYKFQVSLFYQHKTQWSSLKLTPHFIFDMDHSAAQEFTDCSGPRSSTSNFYNNIASATVNSISANWSPIHFLGLPPNGKNCKVYYDLFLP